MRSVHSRRRRLGAALGAGLFVLALAAPAPAPPFQLTPILLPPTCYIVLPDICPCWPAGLPFSFEPFGPVEPLICYEHPGAQTNSFAYYPGPPPLFAQVTDFYCRANATFRFVTPSQRESCLIQLRHACNPPPCPI